MEYAQKVTAGLWVQKSLKLQEDNSYIQRGQTTGSTYFEVDKQEIYSATGKHKNKKKLH